MIEVFLLFCFIAILSAVVSLVRGIAFIVGMMWRQMKPVRDNKRWRKLKI
jgi:hypothetical protein